MTMMNSTTSHEMRNPLNSISSNIDSQVQLTNQLKELIQGVELSQELKDSTAAIFEGYEKSLEISKSSCQMMMFNVEDLLALPQLKLGKLPKHIQTIDIKEATLEVGRVMDFMMRAKEIEI